LLFVYVNFNRKMLFFSRFYDLQVEIMVMQWSMLYA